MAFDECPPRRRRAHVPRASRWRAPRAGRALREACRRPSARRSSASCRAACTGSARARTPRRSCALDFPGYALGGFSVGETAGGDARTASPTSAPLLPRDKPRYLMGVGTPEDLLAASRAASTCSTACCPPATPATACSSPAGARLRNPQRAVRQGPAAGGSRSAAATPAGPSAGPTSATSSRRRRLLFFRLNSIHNLTFYLDLMAGLRSPSSAERRGGTRAECWKASPPGSKTPATGGFESRGTTRAFISRPSARWWATARASARALGRALGDALAGIC